MSEKSDFSGPGLKEKEYGEISTPLDSPVEWQGSYDGERDGIKSDVEVGRPKPPKKSFLDRVRSNASMVGDPGPPPDGGRVAWTQAGLAHLVRRESSVSPQTSTDITFLVSIQCLGIRTILWSIPDLLYQHLGPAPVRYLLDRISPDLPLVRHRHILWPRTRRWLVQGRLLRRAARPAPRCLHDQPEQYVFNTHPIKRMAPSHILADYLQSNVLASPSRPRPNPRHRQRPPILPHNGAPLHLLHDEPLHRARHRRNGLLHRRPRVPSHRALAAAQGGIRLDGAHLRLRHARGWDGSRIVPRAAVAAAQGRAVGGIGCVQGAAVFVLLYWELFEFLGAVLRFLLREFCRSPTFARSPRIRWETLLT
jgi:hypothetical protein